MCAPELKRRFTLDTLVGIIDVVDFGGIDHAFLVDHNGQVIFSLDKVQGDDEPQGHLSGQSPTD